MSAHTQDRFRILSLDGGGVRGYLSATILANIESYLNALDGQAKPLGMRFDFLVGTSVGGLLALGLASGHSAADLRDRLDSLIPAVFGKDVKRNRALRLFRPTYFASRLDSELTELFGGNTLADVSTDLCIPAVSLMDAKPRLHKTGYLARNAGRLDERLVDIARATSAAPTYFSAANLKHSQNLVDGGLVANNPSVIALIDSLQFERDSLRGTPAPSFQDGRPPALLSIGTGSPGPLPYDHSKLLDGGILDWARPIHEVLMTSQSQLAHFQAKFLLSQFPGHYFRMNPTLNSTVRLDDAERFRELRNLADVDADCETFLREHFP